MTEPRVLDELVKDARRWKRQWCPTCTPYECVRSSALYYNHDLSEVAEDPRYIQHCREADMRTHAMNQMAARQEQDRLETTDQWFDEHLAGPAYPSTKETDMITKSHKFEIMEESMRPQDPGLDNAGLTFQTLEHGGEYPDMMPQAIKIIDANGNWCIYLPTSVDGKVVRSHGFNLH